MKYIILNPIQINNAYADFAINNKIVTKLKDIADYIGIESNYLLSMILDEFILAYKSNPQRIKEVLLNIPFKEYVYNILK